MSTRAWRGNALGPGLVLALGRGLVLALRPGLAPARAFALGLVLAACAGAAAVVAGQVAAAVPDAARETRWADEVVPQLVVGDAVWLATPHRAKVLALYTQPTGPAKGAVIVVHGLGVHPDWSLIGELRGALAERGFATLSVQMPVLAADAPREGYADLFPLAAERLDAAVAWLHARGHAQVAVVSHSMGAGMVSAWLARDPGARVAAWVPIGLLVPFDAAPRAPVLDVTAERDYPEALASAKARAGALPRDRCSATVTIPHTDHFLAGAVTRTVDRITPFLERAFDRRC